MRKRALLTKATLLAAAATMPLAGAGLLTPARARAAVDARTKATARTPVFVPHELLVGYSPGRRPAAMLAMERRLGVDATHPATAPRSVVMRLPRRESVLAAARRLRRRPGVVFAEPDYIARAAGFIPNDPGRAHTPGGWQQMQWNLLPNVGVDAPNAWANLLADGRPGGRGVTVAILDTGVAYRNWRRFHGDPDLRGTHFVAPYDFVARNRYPLDRNGHGTFVASIVGEATNNGLGLTGLAYGASIMPVRILDSSGLGDENTIARGIRYAVQHRAQVINLSLEFLPNQVTSASEIPEIVGAINYAHRHGVIVIAAAGNDQDRRVSYPARARNVISVGATTADRCVADYSNAGNGLDLVAPGGGSDAILPSDGDCHPDRILPSIYQMTLTSPPHWARFGYPGYYIGTSMSAPEVAATCALVIASRVVGAHPSPAQVLTHLEQTSTPLGGSRPNRTFGYGLLNAAAATAPSAPPPSPPTPSLASG